MGIYRSCRSLFKTQFLFHNSYNLLNPSRLTAAATATIVNTRSFSAQPAVSPRVDLDSAGKLVDTSVGHFDIRNLMREEHVLSTFALDKVSKLGKGLSSAKHPIISVAQEIFEDHDAKWINSLGGFMLLLYAKCLQSVPSFRPSDEVWEKQRIFAECYEMIDKAMYIHHQSIVNIPPNYDDNKILNVLNNGNKLAVLGGDYLFSFGIIRLASLVRRANVFDFIGASIDEFCVNHFENRQRDVKSQIHPWKGADMKTWEKYGGYCSAKLLAYSCQFMAVMADLSSIRFERSAFNFGYNLKLMWNLQDDIRSFTEQRPKRINPISVPIIKYIEKDPSFMDFLSERDLEKEETMEEVREVILKSDVIDECQRLSTKYSEKCVESLNIVPNCPSRLILESIARGNVSYEN